MPPRSCDETPIITTDPTATAEDVDTEEQRRKGLFAPFFRFRRSHAQSAAVTNKRDNHNHNNHPDEKTVDETDDESSFSSSFDLIDSILGPDIESPIIATATTRTATDPAATNNFNTGTYDNVPESSIHSCLELLSSGDLDRNRVGLQRLVMLTRGRTLSGLHRSEEIASHVLVFGGPLGSVEERLRFIFATMLCDAPHDDHEDEYLTTPAFSDEEEALFDWILEYDPTTDSIDDNNGSENNNIDDIDDIDDDDDDESSCCSYYSQNEYESPHPQGKAEGALHNHALRILANALNKVASSTTEQKNGMARIRLHGTLWKNIIRSLVDNIESNRNADATGYSLKILRLLHSIHPATIVPLLRNYLFTHLVYLTEYGEGHQFPMIYSEASYLLRRAKHNSSL